ncbi:hypothetical protein Q094_05526 [Pseudomonas aeruginosa PS42]|nr:Tn3 family transposase [Pseudomonas aeruginosa]ETU82759.1 hypothetical protein Q094_05526 [Pseudomonas aeruginosa PS42]
MVSTKNGGHHCGYSKLRSAVGAGRTLTNDMVASSVILQNTVDMMRILQKLAREGWQFTDEDVSFLSPYLTSNVKRFGEFSLKLNRPPEPWIKDSVFQQAAGSLRVITPRQLDTEKTT